MVERILQGSIAIDVERMNGHGPNLPIGEDASLISLTKSSEMQIYQAEGFMSTLLQTLENRQDTNGHEEIGEHLEAQFAPYAARIEKIKNERGPVNPVSIPTHSFPQIPLRSTVVPTLSETYRTSGIKRPSGMRRKISDRLR